MKKIITKISIVVMTILLCVLAVPPTYSLLRKALTGIGNLKASIWNVSMVGDADDSLEVIRGELSSDTYSFVVSSHSEVDVTYDVVIRNVPSNVQVKLDDGEYKGSVNGNPITIEDAGTILYSDTDKENSHVLTFKALSGAALANDVEIQLDVVISQKLN